MMLESMGFLIGGMLSDAETRKQTIDSLTETLITHGVAEIAVLMDDRSVHEYKSPREIATATVEYLAAKVVEQQ